MSNPASRKGERAGAKEEGTTTVLAKKISDACKKSLAFMARVGVASASVQGLRIARSSLDGEAMRGFQKLVWSDRLNVGVGASGAPAICFA